MFRLSSRDKRALLAASAILAPLLLYSLVAQPFLRSLRDAHERLVAVRAVYGRELAAAALSDTLSLLAIAQRLQEEHAVGRLLQTGENDSHLELERYVVDMARRQWVSIETSASHSLDERVEGLQAAQIEITAVADLESILNLLYALENGSKLVHIKKMSIRTIHDRDPDRNLLAVNLIIYGFQTMIENGTI